jgi:hypothetical protein
MKQESEKGRRKEKLFMLFTAVFHNSVIDCVTFHNCDIVIK